MRQFGNKALLRRLSRNREFCECGRTVTQHLALSRLTSLAHGMWDYVRTEFDYWDHVCAPMVLVSKLKKKEI